MQITSPPVPVQEHNWSTELTLILAKTDVGCVMEESGFPIIRKGRGFDSKSACPVGFYAFVPKSDTHCALSEDWAGYLCRTGGKVLLYVLVSVEFTLQSYFAHLYAGAVPPLMNRYPATSDPSSPARRTPQTASAARVSS